MRKRINIIVKSLLMFGIVTGAVASTAQEVPAD